MMMTAITSSCTYGVCFYTVLQKVYRQSYIDNFNGSCPIPVIFGTVITE